MMFLYFLKGRVNSILKQSEREQHGHEAEKSCFEGETREGTQWNEKQTAEGD